MKAEYTVYCDNLKTTNVKLSGKCQNAVILITVTWINAVGKKMLKKTNKTAKLWTVCSHCLHKTIYACMFLSRYIGYIPVNNKHRHVEVMLSCFGHAVLILVQYTYSWNKWTTMRVTTPSHWNESRGLQNYPVVPLCTTKNVYVNSPNALFEVHKIKLHLFMLQRLSVLPELLWRLTVELRGSLWSNLDSTEDTC